MRVVCMGNAWLEKLKTRAELNDDDKDNNIGNMFALTTRIVSTDFLAQCDQFTSVDRKATFKYDTFDILATDAVVRSSATIGDDAVAAVAAFITRSLKHFSKQAVRQRELPG